MPELPEVESMKALLSDCCNYKIINTKVLNSNLRKKVNNSFVADTKNTEILNIERIGKFLIFNLSNKKCVVMHAGMSGIFTVDGNDNLLKHDHIVFYLKDNRIIKYNDPRRFGLALSFNNKQEALSSSLFKNIAIDALDKKFNADYLLNKVKNLTSNIKNTLLNQNIVAGIGNIYASEILFYSKISPLRACNSLSNTEIAKIVDNTSFVLNKAITLGGSTLKDYRLPNGSKGGFQNEFAVYNKKDQPCPNCGTLITKITQSGRATYFCPKEQL